jgi:hypothetical protein
MIRQANSLPNGSLRYDDEIKSDPIGVASRITRAEQGGIWPWAERKTANMAAEVDPVRVRWLRRARQRSEEDRALTPWNTFSPELRVRAIQPWGRRAGSRKRIVVVI